MIKLTPMWRWMLAVVLGLAGIAQGQAGNVVPNGDFERQVDGWFEAWSREPLPAADPAAGRIEPAEEQGNHFMRFALTAPEAVISTQRISLDPAWQHLDVSVRLRGRDIQRGEQHWQTARLEYTFQNKDGKHIAGWPWLGLREDGSTDGWVRLTNTRMRIPEGAAYLQLAIGMWDTTGTVDIDDVTVIPIESAAVRALRADPHQADPLGGFGPADAPGALPPGWQINGDGDAIAAQADDAGNIVIRIRREAVGDSYLSRRFVVHPWWAEMNIGADIRTEADFEVSGGFRHGANVRYRFYDADDRQIQEDHIGAGSGAHDWQKYSHEQRIVPAGTVEMEVLVGLFGSRGTAEFRLPHARPKVVERKPGEAPRQLQEQWASTAPQAITDHRARLVLDGQWQFQPARASAAREPVPDAWGTIAVPGNWPDAIAAYGAGGPWEDFVAAEASRGWYRRDVTVPKEWEGRSVVLGIDHLSTDAKVWVNGKDAGEVRWPGGTLEIAQHLKPGENNEIRVLVVAAVDRQQAERAMGDTAAATQPAPSEPLASRGLIGSVDLLARPRGAHVADVHVRTSTRQRAVEVDVELAGVSRHGQAQLRAEMLDENGAVEKTFEQSVPIAVARLQKVTARWAWEDPRLFDVGQPNRYTLRLSVSGPGFEDSYVRPFGFREFWIDGRSFFLNGTEIRLRPHALAAGGSAKALLDRGYNFAEVIDADAYKRGAGDDVSALIAEAEAVGLLVAAPLGPMEARQAEAAARTLRVVERDLRRWRNHASVVMWSRASADQPMTAPDPRHLSPNAGPATQPRSRAAAAAAEAIEAIDPTRPVYVRGQGQGDIQSVEALLRFLPLQEREEWISAWAAEGQRPLMVSALGMPLHLSLLRGSISDALAGHTEPFLSEWSAVYLGSEAYRLEPAEYRAAIAQRYQRGDAARAYETAWQADGSRLLSGSPAFARVLELFAINTWRSWRTMGITGGMAPFIHDDSNDVPALRGVNGPSLAWIAGAGGLPQPGDADADSAPAFTAKDHSFAVGQDVAKQVALLNDHRSAVPAEYEWKAFVGDQQVGGGKSEGPIDMQPAQTRLLPIAFTIPGEIPGEKVGGRIELTAKIGNDEHRDVFAFEVFAPIPAAQGVLSVFDPLGETTAMLTALGYETKPWTAGNASGELVVIGRKALSDGHALPGEIQTYLANGGRVIVMGQDPRWMRHGLNLRTVPSPARRVFRVSGGHPIVVGLDDNDLRDWSGVSRLTAGYPQPAEQAGALRWGNRGAVASAVIEKPHRSGLRPILECEFDLAYSPLMEVEYGRGRLMVCGLDFEDHVATTPAARKLARQVFEYARTASITAKVDRVVYLGGAEDAAVLDLLGVKYEQVETLDRPADLLILGRGAAIEDSMIAALAGQGARVLVMRHDQEGEGPLGARYEQAGEFAGSVQVPDWFEARGLSASDLRWRAGASAVRLRDGNEKIQWGADGQISKMPVGQGLVIFAQVHPAAVPADEKHYFRLTRWRQTRALAQLLSNLGASFVSDDRLVQLIEQPNPPSTRPVERDSLFYHPDYIRPQPAGNGQPASERSGKSPDDPYRF